MSATLSFQSALIRLILLNEQIMHLGDFDGILGSSTAGSVYICLLTQAPGEAGDLTNEATYGGYARLAIARGAGGWTEVDGRAVNAAVATFAACTSGAEDITHFGVCMSAASDDMMFYGELPNKFPVSAEVQPSFEIGQLAIELD